MKTLLVLLATAGMAASLCLGAARADPAGPRIKPWGFDLAGRDTSVVPGNDFYAYADGTYVRRLKIPPDQSRYGSFDALAALSEDRVHEVIENAAADPDASGERAKVGAFYRAFMDEERVDALGAGPLAPELAAIRAADNRTAIARLMGRGVEGFYGGVFTPSIQVDEKDPGRYAVYLGQSGLGMPDRDYYLGPSFAAQKAAYQAYVARMLKLADWPDAEDEAKAIVDMETQLAAASWTMAQDRDSTATYNPMTPAQLEAVAPGFDWAAFLDGAEVGGVGRVVVSENTAFPKIAAIVAATPVKTLQAWEAFDVVDSAAPFLSKPFVDAQFAFRSKTLSGQPQQRPRWRRAVGLLNGDMGEAVGRLYVDAYFPSASKAKIEVLVANVRAAFARRIERVSWMSELTRARALQKLSMLSVKIAYPSKWRDYGPLRISDDDLVGDVERASAFDWQRRVKRLNGPVDRTEWEMNPQTVNSYYNPTMNEIVLPAAILQPPFFDPAADMAVNYGGIGGVIGHEMTHGFDDQGRNYDGAGRLDDWWTPQDAARFAEETQRLGAQYSAVQPIPGAHIKGDQTMGENLADLGGSLLALDAYDASLAGKPAPVLDGLTGDQRVFLGWAQVWASAIRPDALKRQLVSDPHSPASARVNGVVRNIDAWYDAWNVKPGDALYLAPAERVRIW